MHDLRNNFGLARRFNGVDQFLSRAEASVPITDAPMSGAIWFCSFDVASYQVLMNLQDYDQSSDYWVLYAAGAVANDPLILRVGSHQPLPVGGTNATTTSGYKVGRWHHAYWQDAGTEISVWLDGRYMGSASHNREPGAVGAIDTIALGVHRRTPDQELYFNGLMCHAALWSGLLSARQRQQLAAGARPDDVKRTPLSYWPLQGDDRDIIGGYDLTPSGDPGWGRGPVLGRVSRRTIWEVPEASLTPYPTAVLADEPVAYWRLGDSSGTTATDSSGNGNHGTYSNVTLGTTGLIEGDDDTAVTISGENSGVTFGAIGTLGSNLASGYTFEAIIKGGVLEDGSSRHLVNHTASGSSIVIAIDSQDGQTFESGYLYFHYNRSGTLRQNGYAAVPSIDDDSSHHLVVTLDPTTATWTVYLDSVAQSVTYINQDEIDTHIDFTSGMLGNQNGGAILPLEMVLDEAAVYNAVLSAEQVAEHFSHVFIRMAFSSTLRGTRLIYNVLMIEAGGRRSLFNSFRTNPRGQRRLVFAPYTAAINGTRAIYNAGYTITASGKRRIGYGFTMGLRGLRKSIYNTFNQNARGKRSMSAVFVVSAIRGLRRIANDSKARYEMYVGVGEDPDTSGTPDATSATLPVSVDLDPDGTYHLMVLPRNRWGLRHNVAPVTVITLDANGDQVLAAPRDPSFITAAAIGGGRIRITAGYEWRAEPTAVAADQWVVWAKVGSDPVPGSDSPIATIDHVKTHNVELLEYDATGFANGADVRVLARAARSSDDVQSTNTTAVQVTAVDAGALVSGTQGFLGRRAKQQP